MIRKIAIVLLTVIIIFAIAQSLGFFSDKDYIEINHGNHIHYVPQDRDPNIPLDDFPMTKPKPDETITPDGRVVKKSSN